MKHIRHINVYGPQGSGKGLNAEAIAKFYHCTRVIDEDQLDLLGEVLRGEPGRTLILSQTPVFIGPGMVDCIRIEDAIFKLTVPELRRD